MKLKKDSFTSSGLTDINTTIKATSVTSRRREANAIACGLSIDELFIAMQPTEKDKQEAIQFLKNETIRNLAGAESRFEQKVAKVQKETASEKSRR